MLRWHQDRRLVISATIFRLHSHENITLSYLINDVISRVEATLVRHGLTVPLPV